ncbi:MAG: phosphohydrolase [Candidatus Korarchaeum sp.]
MMEEAESTIFQLLVGYPKAMKMWKLLREDPEVNADWDMSNYIAVAKLGYNDHGEVHAKIVAANALKMLRLLLESGVLPSIIKERAGDEDDAHLIVLVGSLLHDIGNQVHRENHPSFGIPLAISVLNRLLPQVYDEPEVMYEVRAHILHCIVSHEAEARDLTEEASIVGIADGTDMTKGRGRLAFNKGNVNIHTVSALSIERVNVKEGEGAPVRIEVHMNNSAGIFQVQETLGKKVKGSPIEDYVEIVAVTVPDEPKSDQRIVHQLIVKEGRFRSKD